MIVLGTIVVCAAGGLVFGVILAELLMALWKVFCLAMAITAG